MSHVCDPAEMVEEEECTLCEGKGRYSYDNYKVLDEDTLRHPKIWVDPCDGGCRGSGKIKTTRTECSICHRPM